MSDLNKDGVPAGKVLTKDQIAVAVANQKKNREAAKTPKLNKTEKK